MSNVLFYLFVAFTFAYIGSSESQFILYSNSTNKYVTVDPSSLILYANGTTANAAVFQTSTASGDSISIIYLINGRYVSDNNGNSATTADRSSVGTWEEFLIVGRSTGVAILGTYPNKLLAVQSDNTLVANSVNDPNNINIATIFTSLPPVAKTPTAVSSVTAGIRIIIYSVSAAAYVVIDTGTSPQYLVTTGTSAAAAAVFNVVTDGTALGLQYTYPQSAVQHSGGTGALIINGDNFGGWEQLSFTAISGQPTGYFTITAGINGEWETVSGTSISPTTTASGTPPSDTQFIIYTPTY